MWNRNAKSKLSLNLFPAWPVVVGLAALPLVFVACGQNAAITEPPAADVPGNIGEQSRGTGGEAGTPDDSGQAHPNSGTGEVEPDPHDGDSGGTDPGEGGTPGGSPDDGSGEGEGNSDPENDRDGDQGNRDGESGEGERIIVIPGEDGRDGRAGRDGQDGRDGCGERPTVATFTARPMSDAELASVELPYRATRRHAVRTLQIGRPTHARRENYVKDAHQVFAIDLSLPPRAAVKEIHELRFNLSLRKYSRDRYAKTELICFLGERLCSGKRFEARSWQANLNPSFWDDGGRILNTYFSDQLVEQEITATRNARVWDSEALNLDLRSMIEGSDHVDLLDFLYGEADPARFTEKTLLMVIADDTLVRSAQFIVNVEEDTCVSAQAVRENPLP